MMRRVFRGELGLGGLIVRPGGWVQRVSKDGDASESVWDRGMRLYARVGQVLSIGGENLDDWADVAICEVVGVHPDPSRVDVRPIAGSVREGRVFVEPVPARRGRRAA
jgi:hypothetical protein